MITASKTPAPNTPAPSPPPPGPTGPTPTGPGPQRFADDLMAVAEVAGVAAFPSQDDRAGAVTPGPGAVSDFALPDTRLPLVFAEGRRRLVGAVRLGDGPPRPGHPGPPPSPGPGPVPQPPPPVAGWSS